MYHPEGSKVIEDRLVAPDVQRVVMRGQAMVKHLGATQAASGGGREEEKRGMKKKWNENGRQKYLMASTMPMYSRMTPLRSSNG
jgi:hypothetical protein